MTIPNTTLRLKGFASTLSHHEVIAPHQHVSHQILHARGGVMRVTTTHGVWVVPPERALWLPAQIEHEIRSIGTLHMRTIYFRGDHPLFPDAPHVTAVSPLMREMMIRIAEGIPDPQQPHFIALLLDEIATLSFLPLYLPRPQTAALRQICHALLATPADTTPLTEWATRLHMTARTLMRHLQRETGMTFRELRRQARILAAIERLPQAASITTVAMDVGFDTASAFSQAFRTVTGQSPREYVRATGQKKAAAPGEGKLPYSL